MLQNSQDVLLCKASVVPVVEVATFPVGEALAKVALSTRSWLVDSHGSDTLLLVVPFLYAALNPSVGLRLFAKHLP